MENTRDDGLNHPADRLALVRQRIKALQEQEAELKTAVKELALEDRAGRYYEAKVTEVKRRMLDREKLFDAYGAAEMEKYMTDTSATVVTVKAMEG